VLVLKTTRLKEKLDKLKEEMGKLAAYEKQMLASPDGQISLTDPDRRSTARWQRVAWFGRRLLQCALNWRAALASRTSSVCLKRVSIVAQPCSG